MHKSQRHLFSKAALLSLGSLIATGAQASGFALNEQSVSGLGSAYAGRAALAEDAATIYGNPAGMSYLEGDNLSTSLIYLNASVDIKDTGSNTPLGASTGTNKGDIIPDAYIPSLFYSHQIDSKWNVGFGIYSPFGLATEYESSSMARNHALDSEIMTVNFQPTVSYKFNDEFSVGGGVYASYVDAKLSKALDYPAPWGGTGVDGKSKMTGDDWGWGYNLGMIWQVSDATRLGLTYHSKTEYTLEGDLKLSGTGLGNIGRAPGTTKVEADLTTPESVEMAITHQLNDRLTLLGSATFTRWSRFEELHVVYASDGSTAEQVDEKWHNTWFYSLGAHYKLDDQWLLRAGYAIDESPIGNTHRTARIPSGDRQWFTLGARYDLDEDISIDLGAAYLIEEEVSVNETNAAGDNYRAEYDGSVFLLGAQLNYAF